MTTLSLGTIHRPASSLLVGTLLGRLVRGFDQWQARRAMAKLDDEALHDLGVDRSAIDAVVRGGREALWH